jgi:hypothetical protein
MALPYGARSLSWDTHVTSASIHRWRCTARPSAKLTIAGGLIQCELAVRSQGSREPNAPQAIHCVAAGRALTASESPAKRLTHAQARPQRSTEVVHARCTLRAVETNNQSQG